MANILYDNGIKVGEISDWQVANMPPVYKTFLGKTVLSIPANDECTFISPKPVKRKSSLVVIENGKYEYHLKVVKVTGSTAVAAKILKKENCKA